MHSDIYIEMTEDTPEVILNRSTHKFCITGLSLPEDSRLFYSPIIKWLIEYVEQPFDSLCLDIKLLYFNTTTAKELAKLLNALSCCPQHEKIVVRWFYDFRDPENIECCKRYEFIPLHFEYYEYDFTELENPSDMEAEGTYHIIS